MADSPKLRRLGGSGPTVSSLGLGCWAIGGPFFAGPAWGEPAAQPLGWGQVDDAESTRAIHCALDHGITLFDTADAYGTGHSEQVLGKALGGRRAEVVVATKFGNTYDERTRQLIGIDVTPAYIRQACVASLRRLQTEWIDLYQLHIGDLPIEQAADVLDALEELCDEGLIRFYGWSTDDPERVGALAGRPRAVAVQHNMNLLEDAPAMLQACRRHDLASINRGPLAMGLLSGKYSGLSRLPQDDIRSRPPAWLQSFTAGGGASPERLAKLADLKQILTSEGRSLVQGALDWNLACDERTIPIPGFRTEAQVKENAAAMSFGPLSPDQMAEIDRILGRL